MLPERQTRAPNGGSVARMDNTFVQCPKCLAEIVITRTHKPHYAGDAEKLTRTGCECKLSRDELLSLLDYPTSPS